LAAAAAWLCRGQLLTERHSKALPAERFQVVYDHAGHPPEPYVAIREST
jgi:hypothetical protein